MDATLLLPCSGVDVVHARTLQCQAAVQGFPVVHVIPNRRYGEAIRLGLTLATTPWVAMMDTDGQHTWEDLDTVRCVAERGTADLVIGCRRRVWHPRGLASCALNLVASILAGRPVPDFGSGVRIMRRTPAQALLPHLPKDFGCNAAMTLGFLLRGYRVVWVRIPRRARLQGRSTIRLWDGPRTLGALGRCWYAHHVG